MATDAMQNDVRAYAEILEVPAIAGSGGSAMANGGRWTPPRDISLSELLFEAWDANYQAFARENRSSGNTAAGNAVPSMAALRIGIKEDGNASPFEKPFRATLLTSLGHLQRQLPDDCDIKFYKNAWYEITVYNDGPVACAGAQFLILYPRPTVNKA